MPNTNTFSGRMGITELIENNLNKLFDENEITIIPHGVLNIIKDKADVEEYLSDMEVNVNPSAMIVKFAPDFIIYKKTEPRDIYFLEVKCSITPCWALSRIAKIQQNHPGEVLNESNIGEVAREALLSYNRFYPKTIVLYGSPYNSKVLMAQYANNIECLYCYKSNGEYDCNNCPSKNNGYFEIERNPHSNGSQTANTNINLDSFVCADEFFESLGIHLNEEGMTEVCQAIKNQDISVSETNVDCDREEQIRETIINSGCEWVSRVHKYYGADGNDFYHDDAECFTLNGQGTLMYRSEKAAIRAGKRKCKFCC